MTALVLQADAHRLPLPDESVDLICTSPPYFALRSYRDGDEHYAGQLGSEATPQAFLESLWTVTAECWRVLKPSGSMFVNLGDKRSGSDPRAYRRHTQPVDGGAGRREATALIEQASPHRPVYFGRTKSKMLLPHRYAIGCEDGLADPDGIGWIVRQDIVWSKPNGLPESVRDRTRDAHEYWFHLCKRGDYFSAVDEIREPHSVGAATGAAQRLSEESGPYRGATTMGPVDSWLVAVGGVYGVRRRTTTRGGRSDERARQQPGRTVGDAHKRGDGGQEVPSDEGCRRG